MKVIRSIGEERKRKLENEDLLGDSFSHPSANCLSLILPSIYFCPGPIFFYRSKGREEEGGGDGDECSPEPAQMP